MEPDKSGILDRAQQKLSSRKFIVFIIATVMMFMGTITPEYWVYVAGIYIGTQAVIDSVSIIKTKMSAMTGIPTVPAPPPTEDEDENAAA